MAKETYLGALNSAYLYHEHALAYRVLKPSNLLNKSDLVAADFYTLRNIRRYRAKVRKMIRPRGKVIQRIWQLQQEQRAKTERIPYRLGDMFTRDRHNPH